MDLLGNIPGQRWYVFGLRHSNTTLTTFLPGLAAGACIVLMPKFDAKRFLEVADKKQEVFDILQAKPGWTHPGRGTLNTF